MGPQPEASCVAQPLAEEPSEPFSSPYLIAGRQPVEEGVAKWPPHLECDQASENRNRTSCRRDEIREDIEGPREGKRPPSVFREAGGSAGLAKGPASSAPTPLYAVNLNRAGVVMVARPHWEESRGSGSSIASLASTASATTPCAVQGVGSRPPIREKEKNWTCWELGRQAPMSQRSAGHLIRWGRRQSRRAPIRLGGTVC